MDKFDLNVALRPIDYSSKRFILGLNLDKASDSDVASKLYDVMLASHQLAINHTRAYRAELRRGFVEMSDKTIAKLLKSASASDKAALKEFYGSISRSVSNKAMSKVRAGLMSATLREVRGKDGDRAATKAVGRPKVHKDSPVLETVFRTQAALAYNAAAWAESSEDDYLWGFEYTTAGDERVRDSHVSLDGVRYPVGHEFWTLYAPINGWNCRCALVPIYKDERKARIKKYSGTPDVDKAFRVNFGSLFSSAL